MKFKKIGEDFEEDRYDESDYYEEGAHLSDEELEIGNQLTDVLQGLIDDEVIDEEFVSERSLVRHYNTHCIADHTDRKSNRHNVFYDFKNIDKYRVYEDKINRQIDETPYYISSLFDEELCRKYFRKLFEGNVSLRFTLSCNLRNNEGLVELGLHSFASNYTTNYNGGNTIDMSIRSPKGETITFYAVDAHYLENKINNIFSNYYSGDDKVPPYKFNNG